MAIRFLSNQTIDSTLDLTGRVKVSGNNTDQYFYEGARTGVGVTFSLYDNANNVYFNGYSGIVLRANQIGGSGGSIILSGGNVGIGITPAGSVALDVKEPDASNDLILGLTAGTGSRAQIRSVVQTSTESALSFHTTLSSSTQERFRILNTGAFSLGNSGTNYGSAGQVLTSNGNAAPYWSTPTSGTITGSGTANYVTKFTGTTAIGNSSIVDNGSIVTMNQDVHMDNGSASTMLVFRNDAKTRKIQLWSAANNDNQFYGFGIEGSTLVYSIYDVGDSHVFFAGSSSTSRSELMRIKGNGNVGINTNSPTNLLDIKGNGNSKGLDIHHSNGNMVAQLIHGGSGDEGQLKLYDSNAETVRISGENNIASFINSGNVGIGTAAPADKLTISGGSVNIQVPAGSLKFNEGSTNAFAIESNGANGYFKIRDTYHSADRLYIKNTGNVGIGYDNPQARLDIQDNTGTPLMTRSSSGLAMFNEISGGYSYLYLYQIGGGAKVVLSTNGNSYFTGGKLAVGTTSPQNQFVIKEGSNVDMEFGSESSGCFIQSYNRTSSAWGYLRFIAGGGEQMRIHTNGYVGIGNTSPTYKLSVNHGASAGGGITTVANFSAGTGSSSGDGAQINLNNWGDNYGGFIRTVNTQGTPNYLNPKMEFGLNYNNYLPADMITRMTILGNGYVGIGNTNPQTLLQVTSNTTTKLRVNTTGVADSMVEILGYDAGLHIGDNTNGNRWAIWNDGPGTNTSLNFGSYALGTWYVPGSQVMTMTSSGRIGVGTTAPSARLQVNFDGNNGGGGAYTGYGILHQSSASGQATIGAHNTGDGYANLNLSSTVGGAQKLWHISKRPNSNSNRLEYFFYDSTFYSRFIFTYLGDFHADGDIVAYSTTASDEKLKDNIEPIHNALDKVSKLNGVSFTWNCGSRKDEKDLGVIAQNVEKVLPELVREKESPYHDDQTIKTVDYEKLTAVLIEAVKELQQKVEKLENKNCACKG